MEKFELFFRDVNTMLKINAQQGDVFSVRPGAMISMDDIFDLKLNSGGVKKALGRFWSGQGTFLQKYTAKESGELIISPSFLGDIRLVDITRERNYRLGQSAFLFSYGDIDMSVKSAGGKGIMSGEGMFQMEVSGNGKIGVAAYGGIYKKELEIGQRYFVDTNQLVLWDAKMEYKVEMISDGFTSFIGGEGWVCKFVGPGEIWIQTKNPSYMGTPAS